MIPQKAEIHQQLAIEAANVCTKTGTKKEIETSLGKITIWDTGEIEKKTIFFTPGKPAYKEASSCEFDSTLSHHFRLIAFDQAEYSESKGHINPEATPSLESLNQTLSKIADYLKLTHYTVIDLASAGHASTQTLENPKVHGLACSRCEEVNAQIIHLLNKVDCARVYSDPLPFIGTAKDPFNFHPKSENDRWLGVEFTHTTEKKSPHVTGTHVEASRHVIGNGKTLQEVIDLNPRYLETMEGVHVKIKPIKATVLEKKEENGQTNVMFTCGDRYSVTSSCAFETSHNDRVITQSQVKQSLDPHAGSKTDILLLEIEDESNLMSNWAYLTNEAVSLILERGFRIIALNTPSMDREKDGGLTPNHKLIFEDESRLILEAANFEHLKAGKVAVTLNLSKLDEFVDCAKVEHLFVSQTNS